MPMTDRNLKIEPHDWTVLIKLDDSEILRSVLIKATGQREAEKLAAIYVFNYYTEKWNKIVRVKVISAGILTYAITNLPDRSYSPVKIGE